MNHVDILIATMPEDASRYYKNLSRHEGFSITIVHNFDDAKDALADRDKHVDIFVVDNKIGRVFAMIGELRQSYPRLIIITVDEEADFGMPGQADEMSTSPFENDDLARRIRRLMSDRQMETLRSDSLPAVRNFAKTLRAATGVMGKQQASVKACFDMGYDYVGYYHKISDDPIALDLKAQEGPAVITSITPRSAGANDLMGWVQQNGQSRIAAPEDTPNHPLVARGRLGAVVCVPVAFNGVTYGVMAACRDRPGSITQDNVLMLELIGSQLGAAIAKELRS